jgi:D-beta-D-heptose 7-phosphate kinase / D-beta-D-heptose 1-phosphate adenosyltransferase
VVDLGLEGATPEKVRILAGDHPLVRLDRGGGTGCGPLPSGALDGADAVLVSDYGHGLAAEPSVRAALSRLRVPLVWDPHPRGPTPVRGVTLITPNRSEVNRATGIEDPEYGARELKRRWNAVAIAVTLGARGALLVTSDAPAVAIPARAVSGDPCGAGDCFAATAAVRLASGALPSEAVWAAVEAATAFVEGAETAAAVADGAIELAERLRRSGKTVVATGGCFDLLHAGHVRMLEHARALGDCLIVCLNSDASVQRLKGPERPLVGQDDRAAVLRALACVDAVVVFDEDDPREVVRSLRPHLWVKGGDYAMAELPEAEALAEWGGRTVLVPHVAGRSTTRLISEARARAH